jgi:hypothetical protein
MWSVSAWSEDVGNDVISRMRHNSDMIEKHRQEMLNITNPPNNATPPSGGVATNSSVYDSFLLKDIFCEEDGSYSFANDLFQRSAGKGWKDKTHFSNLVFEKYKTLQAGGDSKEILRFQEFLMWLGVYVKATDSDDDIRKAVSNAVASSKIAGCTQKQYFIIDTACHDLVITTTMGRELRFRFDRPIDTSVALEGSVSANLQTLKNIHYGTQGSVPSWLCGP